MKKPKHVDFPETEYRRRIRRAANLLRERNLDGLILTQSENVYYMTGIQHVDVIKNIKDMPPTVTILTRHQEPIIVSRWPASHAIVREACWPEAIVSYSQDEQPAVAIVRAFREYGLNGGRVGMELGDGMRLGLSVNDFEVMRKKASQSADVQIVDGTAVVWKLRSIKSNFEIERLRRSAHATCKALEYATQAVGVGVNMMELAQKAGQVMMEEGAFWYNTQINYPPFAACIAFDAKVPRGYIRFDFGAE